MGMNTHRRRLHGPVSCLSLLIFQYIIFEYFYSECVSRVRSAAADFPRVELEIPIHVPPRKPTNSALSSLVKQIRRSDYSLQIIRSRFRYLKSLALLTRSSSAADLCKCICAIKTAFLYLSGIQFDRIMVALKVKQCSCVDWERVYDCYASISISEACYLRHTAVYHFAKYP